MRGGAVLRLHPHRVVLKQRMLRVPRWLRKRSGGRRYRNIGGGIGRLRTWKRRWFVVKDSFVAYFTDPQHDEAVDVVLFDQHTSVEYGVEWTVAAEEFLIRTGSRRLLVQAASASVRDARGCAQPLGHFAALTGHAPLCRSRQLADQFVSALTTHRSNMPWTKPQPHGSFAPVRCDTQARWLIDGFRTFNAMADALESATAEIMIAGWWVAPDLVLRRRTGDDSRYARGLPAAGAATAA